MLRAVRPRRSLFVPALAGALLLAALPASPAYGSPPGAKALEASLLSPCCYQGTLDVHDSELARELRKEIEGRVARGESTDAIEADLVARYGPEIVAMPSPRAFSATTVAAMGAIVLAGLGMGLMVRRWRRAEPPRTAPPAAGEATRDAYDERLDEELRDLA